MKIRNPEIFLLMRANPAVTAMYGNENSPMMRRYRRLPHHPVQSEQENGLGMVTLNLNNLDNPFSRLCMNPEQSMMKQMMV